MQYSPAAPFTHLATQDWAVRLWCFLNRPDNIIRMRTAIELKRAPLEGVLKFLDWDYSSYMKDLQHRQMTGHMVGQIVTHHLGAHHNNRRALIRKKNSNFKSAMRYSLSSS